MDIATKEPKEVVLGDTIVWRREDLSDLYPSPTWTLTYYFVSRDPATKFTLTATQDGTAFLCTLSGVSSVQPSFVRVGQSGYEWVARVSNGSTKYVVASGFMSIAPDVATLSGGSERRGWAVRTLEKLRAVIEGRADADVNSYMIAGKQVAKMTPAELRQWHDWIERLANNELAAIAPQAKKSRVLKVRLARSG